MTITPPIQLTAATSNCRIFPVLTDVKLVRGIRWSATRMGPHYALSFDEFGNDELQLRPDNLLVIGSYRVERPFNAEVSDVAVSLSDGTVAIIPPVDGTQVLTLATSLPKLSLGLVAFYELHESLSKLTPNESSEACWDRFERQMLAIDPNGFQHDYSYWGNMVQERKEMS